ncbi:MAG: hypothetical protein HWE34_15590, partial [Methylocystaceae bacterium]|nr:hypothetical protein [Methylocystaceae bacterium]
NIRTNAEVDGELLLKISEPDQAGKNLLLEATNKLKLSARGYHRVLRVARTLADLEQTDKVTAQHIGESLSYRPNQLRKDNTSYPATNVG